MSDELERYRRALEKIRDHAIKGPVDEWAEAAAYHEVVELAADALSPGLISARQRREREQDAGARAIAKKLRREASAGKRHRLEVNDLPGLESWFVVCVLNDKHERGDIVHVKVEKVVGRPFQAWRVGERIEVNVHNLKPDR